MATTPIPGLQMSAYDIIASALRLVHVLAPGETLDAAAGQDGLMVLNQMMDAWQADRLMIFTVAIQDFPFVPNKASYTLGPLGDFDTARPAEISYASIVVLDNPAQPLEIPLYIYLNEAEWQQVQLRNVVSTFPLGLYDDGGFPFRTLTFWPIPLINNKLRLYSWQALAQFPDLSTKFAFPPGYQECIRYNLAVRLADEFSGELGPTLVLGATQSLARIKAKNVPLIKLQCDAAYLSGSEVGTNNWRAEMFNLPY